MIEIYLLEQFVKFAEKGSLLKASLELHLSQPALSRSMKKLENEFGVQLFDRSSSKLVFNQNGELALEYAKKILALNEEMTREVILNDKKSRTINVGSCSPFPMWKITSDINKEFPELTVSNEIAGDDELIGGLKNRQYQVIITVNKPENRLIYSKLYFKDKLYVSIPRRNPLAEKKSIRLSDLAGTDIFISESSGYWYDTLIKNNLKGNLIDLKDGFRSFDLLFTAGKCAYFVSDRYLDFFEDDSFRAIIPVDEEEARPEYYISCLMSERSKYAPLMNYDDKTN